ncbi:isocitrate lyase/phosphoenolpyruvate mutase family protein [Ensifer adhaerens]|uniref:isocitrate lyase/PEP mutase family protein n=1 Tax=Ensifer adhaerens TaxID=106592 RepID=UPI0023A93AA4|nr:isocitrate lyase/phosphoenolpyruvate mutase family protein [Ensifer adhaerens]WDZ77592.1 isocitrate lyase/phosphoenolpyruvate mutase family protein [Ensifer adhaerens]
MNCNDNAAIFHALHRQSEPLRLPNAWDAGSALLIESHGARAIATTSAGVAWSHGYRDGDVLPLDRHLATVAAIVRVINVPLSVDIEAGYIDESKEMALTTARFIQAGAIGFNIQDGIGTPDLLCRKIEQARETAERLGIGIYINARTDLYTRAVAPAHDRVEEVLARARQYRDAGADGLFVLGVTDRTEIREIAKGTELLLNVIAWPGLPPAGELSALGVSRISVGSWIPQTLWAQTSTLVAGFLADGRSEPLYDRAAPYPEVNAYF